MSNGCSLCADVLCQSFTGLSGGVCPGGSGTFTCVADATTITWTVVTPGRTDNTCSSSLLRPTDTCGPLDMFMSSQTEDGGTNSSTLSVESLDRNKCDMRCRKHMLDMFY